MSRHMSLKTYFGLCAAICLWLSGGCSRSAAEVAAPRGDHLLRFELRDGRPSYTLLRGRDTLIGRSALGFRLADGALDSDFRISEIAHRSHAGSWVQLWGEDSLVEEVYNEMVVSLETRSGKPRRMDLILRAYDDGVAFRYRLPEGPNADSLVVLDECTEFALPPRSRAWSIPWDTPAYEGLYELRHLASRDTLAAPITVVTPDSLFMTLHEAALVDYASLNLRCDTLGRLHACPTPWQSGVKAFVRTPFVSPWRMILIARNPGELLLSRLLLNLNEPNRIPDAAEWIRPGNYLGIWWGIHMGHYTWHESPQHGASTQNVIRYMDFAAKHGFSAVLAEGWNKGWDTWNFDFCTPASDFDLERVARHADSCGVRFIAHHETAGDVENYESQLERAFALCRQFGIGIVKTGYCGGVFRNGERHGSQYGVRHYQRVVETAARYRIMIDCHEPVMPTGLQRTWPNLMTQEGVRGQEWDAWSQDGGNPPSHTTILPFTRGLAGPMDFTPGTFRFENEKYPQTRVRTTLAKQLALSVVLYSPLQMASDRIENYDGNPALDFLASCRLRPGHCGGFLRRLHLRGLFGRSHCGPGRGPAGEKSLSGRARIPDRRTLVRRAGADRYWKQTGGRGALQGVLPPDRTSLRAPRIVDLRTEGRPFGLRGDACRGESRTPVRLPARGGVEERQPAGRHRRREPPQRRATAYPGPGLHRLLL